MARTVLYISAVRGEEAFLSELRADLKARRFVPLPVRERMIPKPGGKLRRLGIPTVRDRVVQAALKTGARADLRGGLPAVLATASAPDAGPRTPSPRSTMFSFPLLRVGAGG